MNQYSNNQIKFVEGPKLLSDLQYKIAGYVFILYFMLVGFSLVNTEFSYNIRFAQPLFIPMVVIYTVFLFFTGSDLSLKRITSIIILLFFGYFFGFLFPHLMNLIQTMRYDFIGGLKNLAFFIFAVFFVAISISFVIVVDGVVYGIFYMIKSSFDTMLHRKIYRGYTISKKNGVLPLSPVFMFKNGIERGFDVYDRLITIEIKAESNEVLTLLQRSGLYETAKSKTRFTQPYSVVNNNELISLFIKKINHTSSLEIRMKEDTNGETEVTLEAKPGKTLNYRAGIRRMPTIYLATSEVMALKINILSMLKESYQILSVREY